MPPTLVKARQKPSDTQYFLFDPHKTPSTPKGVEQPPDKDRLVRITNLKNLLKRLHNKLYGEGPIKTEGILAEEMVKLVLCKIADECSPKLPCEFYATPSELDTEAGREQIAKRIFTLHEQVRSSPEERLRLTPFWIAEVVNVLQPFRLLDPGSYASPLADVYEVFNSDQFKGGRGQFFTPPVVVNLAVELLDPESMDTFIDPACGSGNFLSRIFSKFLFPTSKSFLQSATHRRDFVAKQVKGVDVELALVTLSKRYLRLLSGGSNPNIVCADSLNIQEATDKGSYSLGAYSKLFTNPPFGTEINITSPRLLNQYDLGHFIDEGVRSERLLKAQDPDRLFLELCVRLLKMGGVGAVVVPRQILSGEETNVVGIRKWLLKNVTVRAVIDLPPDTFQPHTGTIVSLLVFEKGVKRNPPPVFFAVCETVGHDRRGQSLYKTDSEGDSLHHENGELIVDDDTRDVIQRWKEFHKRGAIKEESIHGFLVEQKEIVGNPLHLLNAWAYNKNAVQAFKRVQSLVGKGAWEAVVPLKKLCKRIFVPGRHKRKYVANGGGSVPFLSTSQILHIHDFGWKHQPKSFAEAQELLVEEGWILVTRSGSTGRVRYVNSELSKCAISDHCIRIVPDTTKVDSGYLYAFLSAGLGQTLIDQGRYASVIETISHSRLGELPIPLPSMVQQKRVGDSVRRAERARAAANVFRSRAIQTFEGLFESL